MKYIKVYAYKANLGELWRFSKGNPWTFLIALHLKFIRSPKLVSEQPDSSAAREISADELPSEVKEYLSGPMRWIPDAGFTLSLVQRFESARNTVFGLFFTGPHEDRYVPLVVGLSKGVSLFSPFARFAVVSLDTESTPIVTTPYQPQFDPPPTTVFTYYRGGFMKELDALHTGAIKKHRRPLLPVGPGNIREIVQRYEEYSYQHFFSRGIYSEKYEKSPP